MSLPSSVVEAITWSSYEAIKAHADYLQQEEGLTEDEAFSRACQDPDHLSWAYEDMCEVITDWMRELNPHNTKHWHATVENFGWQNMSGHKHFTADTGVKLLQEVLPETECTFTVTRHEDHLHINNAHHDKPTGGEIYIIRPVGVEGNDALSQDA